MLRLLFPALKPSARSMVFHTLFNINLLSKAPLLPSLPNYSKAKTYISPSNLSQPCLPSSIASLLCSLFPPITTALWLSNWTRSATTSDPTPFLLLRSGRSDPTPLPSPRRSNGSRLADLSMPALTVLRM